MGDNTPPPTSHVILPHHIQLLRVLMTLYQGYDGKPLPPPFLLHVHRLLLREIAEVAQPLDYRQFCTELSRAPMADVPISKQFLQEVSAPPNNLQTPEQVSNFFHGVPYLFLDKDEDEPARFSRRSLFGYFCRRSFVTYVKMSYLSIVHLQSEFCSWYNKSFSRGTPALTRRPARKDALTATFQIFKTQADKKEFASPDPFALWERGRAVGDDNIATENLRRFFEQRFHEGSDSGLRQHALLNLARMHFVRREYIACKKLLSEAIQVARSSNDQATLQHCTSMLRRIPPEDGSRAIINDIQPGLHPFEVLADTKKLLSISNQQPLTAAFEKIIQAMGLYDHWIDVQGAPFIDSEQWAQHAVQSVVWSMAGCTQLARIEENIVMAFTDVGGDDDNRLVTTLNRGYYRARQGGYQDAIAMLLEPDVWRGITLDQYNVWAAEIWHILTLRASRRGQVRQFVEFLKAKRPLSPYLPREYWFWSITPMGSLIRDPLYEIMQMRGVDQAHTCVEQLLKALWHAEFQCRYGLYRTAIILLADVGLEFGMTKWCRKIIDEIMPQVISGNELEQRALACFTFARCIIASGDSSEGALRESLPYLKIAEKDFTTLEMFRCLQDVQYLLSVVYHNLDMTKERDDAATRHAEVEKARTEAEVAVTEPWVTDVWELVTSVGAALAAR